MSLLNEVRVLICNVLKALLDVGESLEGLCGKDFGGNKWKETDK